MVEFERDDRLKPLDRVSSACKDALLEPFDVDLDEVRPIDVPTFDNVIEAPDRDGLRHMAGTRSCLVGNEAACTIRRRERQRRTAGFRAEGNVVQLDVANSGIADVSL